MPARRFALALALATATVTPATALGWEGPARSRGTRAGGDGPPAEAAGAPSLAQDLETVLTGRGRAYLAARGRLADAPDATRTLVIERLDQLDRREADLRSKHDDPTQTDAWAEIDRDRGRMVALLADMQHPEDAPRFASQLRAALLEERPADPWRPLLVGLGSAAVPQLAKLVGDTELGLPVRQALLEDLVQVTDPAQLHGLTAQLGQGDRELERTLRRALVRRARGDATQQAALLSALDQSWQDSDLAASTRAAALLVRASIDPAAPWLAKLSTVAADPEAPFAVRVAALSSLDGGRADPSTVGALAAKHLAPEHRAEQRSEVLAWLALRALPQTQSAALVAQHKLRDARAPRLAGLAWSLAAAPPGAWSSAWLDAALRNPWPEVRAAALRRLGGTCEATLQRSLVQRAGPRSGGGDLNPAVARAAAMALGRCGGVDQLRKLIDNSGIGFEQRGVVARALVENDGLRGAREVARRLVPDLAPQLSERYADALSAATESDDSVFAALCRVESALPTAAQSARRSRKRLFPARACD